MDRKTKKQKQVIEQKLIRTTNRIKKARKNPKIAQKEAAEFEEIHKILESNENDFPPVPEKKLQIDTTPPKFLECSVIPLVSPGIKVFDDDSIFSLFNKNSLKLRNFVDSEKEFPKIFGKSDSFPSEDCFRQLIVHHVAENLMPDDEETCPWVNLYVLYLMSVHDQPAFVAACFDFLVLRSFRLEPKQIFPILINFGAKFGDDCPLECDTDLLKKLSGNDGDFKREDSPGEKFPFVNIAMVGKILLHYVTGNHIGVDSETKYLVKALIKISLDPRVRSGSLLPIYSILVSSFCSRIVNDLNEDEILDWLHFREEHLLNQLEICRVVSKTVCPDLHNALLLKTIHSILQSTSIPRKSASMIVCIKSILKKLKSKELPPLEFYSIFQLINSSLPGVTATVEDSVEINKVLTFLESKLILTEDSVDLIRLRLEIAKARNLVANSVDDRFALEDTLNSSLQKFLIEDLFLFRNQTKMVDFFKDSTMFILPLGFGSKRIEFFEKQVGKFGGNVAKESIASVTHVVIEDSVSSSKDSCLLALKTNGFELRKDVSYVKAQWLSKCLGSKGLVDATPFLVDWAGEEIVKSEGGGGGGEEREPAGEKRAEEESGDESGKRRKVDEKMYICSRSSSSNDVVISDRKKLLVDELEKLAEAYKVRNDTWRSYSYRKAANAIRVHDKDITTFQEACEIPGLGEKMASKVMELLESGKLSKVEEIVDGKTRTLQEFCQVWGVGPSTAEGWYVQGFRTLEDLRERAKLTKQQEIGVRLYEDLKKRIPRQEVSEIADIVKNEIRNVSSSVNVELVGSYRRGKETCGDVDLMIVNPGPKTAFEILVQVTATLKAQGYLTDDLVTLEDVPGSSEEGIHHKKYLGVFKLPGDDKTHRRIDLFVVPKSEYAPALVHYTGSAMFNRSMKLLAAKKEMTLTEHGLYAGTVRKGSEVVSKGVLVRTPTEEDIFKELGLPYRHPAERDH